MLFASSINEKKSIKLDALEIDNSSGAEILISLDNQINTTAADPG